MSVKLFEVIDREEKANKGTMDLGIESIVDMDDALHDVNIAAESVRTNIIAMDSAVEMTGIMAETIAMEERVLAAGEITPGIAALANQSMIATAQLLGMDAASVAVSNESIDASPETALRVSVESMKEKFDDVIKKIKAFFSRVASQIKKMAAKAVLAVVNYEKKFEKLAEKHAELSKELKDSSKSEYSDKEAGKIVKKFFGEFASNSGKLVISKYSKGTVVKAYDALSGNVKSIAKREPLALNTSNLSNELIGLSTMYDGLPSGIINEKYTQVVSRNDGTTIKAIILGDEEVELKSGDKIYKVTCTYATGTAKKDLLTKYAKKLKLLSYSDVSVVIDNGVAIAKESKDVVKKIDEIVSDTEKVIKDAKHDAKPGDDKEADQKKIDSVQASTISSLSTNVLKFSSDAILGYLAILMNTTYLANVSMSKYKAGDAE